MLCLRENCFEEIKSQKYFKIFKNDTKYLGVIYDFDGIKNFIKFVKKLQKKITVYQFTLDDNPTLDDYEEVEEFVTLRPIPALILATYRRIFHGTS